jgi:hypothetical protein
MISFEPGVILYPARCCPPCDTQTETSAIIHMYINNASGAHSPDDTASARNPTTLLFTLTALAALAVLATLTVSLPGYTTVALRKAPGLKQSSRLFVVHHYEPKRTFSACLLWAADKDSCLHTSN